MTSAHTAVFWIMTPFGLVCGEQSSGVTE